MEKCWLLTLVFMKPVCSYQILKQIVGSSVDMEYCVDIEYVQVGVPYILESNPHTFLQFQRAKKIRCGLESRAD